MRFIFVIPALLYLTWSSAQAQNSGRPETVFACRIAAKQVTITAVGSNLIYRYGLATAPEMAIVGSRTARNVFWQRDLYSRYASYDQLRFTNGDFSYVIYDVLATADGNSNNDYSGLIVWRGRKKVFDRKCDRLARLRYNRVELMRLPSDQDQWFY